MDKKKYHNDQWEVGTNQRRISLSLIEWGDTLIMDKKKEVGTKEFNGEKSLISLIKPNKKKSVDPTCL